MKRKGVVSRIIVVAAMIVASATFSVGLAGTAQAAACANPVGVTPALDLKANGTNMGYLYLGYFSSCREAYAELHITSASVARVAIEAVVSIDNDVIGMEYGSKATDTVSTNGGWADSFFIPIDQNNDHDIFYSATPHVTIYFSDGYSCTGTGWTHEFAHGNNVYGLDAGQSGNCTNAA
ncbi:hypothetical protein [Kutzneria sp. 744]|uniref:hypothetical protein n=1 Tax=Kutzneria sp. (strain 744) TaxID=345341 RepID=UPI0003EEC69A|nr:hypothetical protein [Kutzneria sp. 744]EWM09840.1 hypothetical protein KUTG_00144 [Kutzneria sp. 744]